LIWIIGLLVVILACAALWRYVRSIGDESDEIVPNQLIVQFHADTASNRIAEIHKDRQCEVLLTDDTIGFVLLRTKQSVEQALQTYLKLVEIDYAEPNYRFHALDVTPNDPHFSTYQYGPQLIHAPEAWELTTSSTDIRIAIVDTGIQTDHPDLSDKLAGGYDFVSNGPVQSDPNGHGTHVAGIAAAVTNNRLGIAGIAPAASILPVRVLDQSGTGTLDQVARGIIFAAQQGAQVINLSLGAPYNSNLLQRAITYACSLGAVVVAGVGNDNSRTPIYPAAYSDVIAVAAVNEHDRKSIFSNYGEWVDVAAPGSEILSTFLNGNYAYLSGTSMAAPHVAGLAALLASQGRRNEEIRSVIVSTADPILGTGMHWVYGRINANRAVRSGKD